MELRKINLNGTTFYLHLNAIHGNQLDLLTLPKFNFWTEGGKLFIVVVTVLQNGVFSTHSVDYGASCVSSLHAALRRSLFFAHSTSLQYLWKVKVKNLFLLIKWNFHTVTEMNYNWIVVISLPTKCNACILAHLILANLRIS